VTILRNQYDGGGEHQRVWVALEEFKGGFEYLGSFCMCICCFTYGLVWFVGEELKCEDIVMIFFLSITSVVLFGYGICFILTWCKVLNTWCRTICKIFMCNNALF